VDIFSAGTTYEQTFQEETTTFIHLDEGGKREHKNKLFQKDLD